MQSQQLTAPGLQVLLIEDDPDDAFLVRDVIRARQDDPPLSLDHAASSADALASLRRRRYDVLLVDYRLGADDGVTLLRTIREMGVATPAVFLTGHGDEQVAVEAMKAGAVDYLLKSKLQPDVLGKALNYAVELGRAESERIKTERALRESEERFRILVDTLPELLLIGQGERIVFVNSAGVRLLGRDSAAELVDRPIGHLVDHKERDAFLERLRQLPEDAPSQLEARFVRRDGAVLEMEVVASRLQLQGRPAIQVVARDATSRHRLEHELRQAQKMEAIGRLAGGVAHDFNNLLSVIMGYAGLAKERSGPASPSSEDLDQILRATERAATLTRQLLAFGRRQIFQPRTLDPNAVLQDLHRVLQRVIGEDVVMRLELESGLGPVFADPVAIESVFMNLVLNARDAMPGGGSLIIETRTVELDDEYCSRQPEVKPGTYSMVAMTDTGTGMDAETQQRIFEPFFTTKEPGKGSGLGLSSAFGIVKQAGGHISVYSELGLGSTFRVYLPRVRAAAEPAKAASGGRAPLTGTETVLVVEDDPDLRRLVPSVLENAGYAVLVAEGPTAALAAAEARRGPLHLLLTDMVMPGMNGRALADRLTAARPALKVLYMSGYTENVIAHHGVLDEGCAFLQKPFTPLELLRKLREVLDADPTPRG